MKLPARVRLAKYSHGALATVRRAHGSVVSADIDGATEPVVWRPLELRCERLGRIIEVEDEGTPVPIQIQAAPAPVAAAGAVAGGSGDAATSAAGSSTQSSFVNQADAPSCMDCGSIMIRNGACYKCPNCGSTSGCS